MAKRAEDPNWGVDKENIQQASSVQPIAEIDLDTGEVTPVGDPPPQPHPEEERLIDQLQDKQVLYILTQEDMDKLSQDYDPALNDADDVVNAVQRLAIKVEHRKVRTVLDVLRGRSDG